MSEQQTQREIGERYVTAMEAARILHITRPKLAALIKSGLLPYRTDVFDKRIKWITLEAVERLAAQRLSSVA